MTSPSAVLSVFLFACCAVAPTGASPQVPARDTKVARGGTAVVKGRVTGGDTRAPLRRARVALSAPSLERTLYASTDAQGRYEFTDVPAGRYTIKASRSPYVALEFGQLRAFQAGKPVDVKDGDVLDKIDFVLPRGAVVAGAVVDDAGESLAGVVVTAYRSEFSEGKRKLVAVGRGAETNDLGQYRLYGLQPGSYFIGTQPMPGGDGYAFAPCYYPGTFSTAEAQRVILGIGQERAGVNFAQALGRLARLSGTVIDASGVPLTSAMVALVNPSTGSMFNTPVKPDGTFLVSNVAPGEYVLAATLRDQASGELQMAGLAVTVLGEDMTGLVLPLHGGSHVIGRLVMEDGSNPPFRPSGLRVEPIPLSGDVPIIIRNPGMQGIVNDDFTFEMKSLGGRIIFRTSRLPDGYMVKAVQVDGRDTTDTPLELRGREEVRGLQVVLTARATQVSGSVTDAAGRPAIDYSVIVFAEDAARWTYPSRFLATARPDQQGHYRVANLPAGRYLAVALAYVEEGQSEDPDYLESLRPFATKFTLGEGDRKTLDLTIPKTPGT
ncbi:MAG: carboxypeptidase regulatory-like domain-containing protein [Bacteroidales bacterium]